MYINTFVLLFGLRSSNSFGRHGHYQDRSCILVAVDSTRVNGSLWKKLTLPVVLIWFFFFFLLLELFLFLIFSFCYFPAAYFFFASWSLPFFCTFLSAANSRFPLLFHFFFFSPPIPLAFITYFAYVITTPTTFDPSTSKKLATPAQVNDNF